MKRVFCFISLFVLCAFSLNAQVLNPGESAPAGALVYSLPSTTLHLRVEAHYEDFVAGPYARFASKYLGVEASLENYKRYKISSIELIPYIEADPSVNIAINLSRSRNASANFLEMINQGLIIWSDSYSGKNSKVVYPNMNSEDLFTRSMTTSNLSKEKTTLYRTVQTATGVERVAVQQNQVIEKSLERRAEETAALIFRLRSKRLDIITGDTDATFSGDAMRAVIEEINRLEQEALSLFLGKVSTGIQTASFDVIPSISNERQMYIAFRVSDDLGLLPANNLSGRPITLEVVIDPASRSVASQQASKGAVLYRKPVMTNVRISDGQTMLLMSRVPIYQLGATLSFPIDIATGRL